MNGAAKIRPVFALNEPGLVPSRRWTSPQPQGGPQRSSHSVCDADALDFAVNVLRSESDAIDRLRAELAKGILGNHNESSYSCPPVVLDVPQDAGQVPTENDPQVDPESAADEFGLHRQFAAAVDIILGCRGSVILSGMGKAGLVAQKISATFASTGTRSHFLHPAEAIHGDLGRVCDGDVVLMFSHSGETEEVTRILPALEVQSGCVIGVTGRPSSTLARCSHTVLILPPMAEACELGLAPSTSTAAMLALGDALALTVSRQRGFTKQDFARFHPGGSLGRQLSKVDEVMRPLQDCRIASAEQTVQETILEASRPGRRTGAVMLVNAQKQLTGIFTDSDLARLFEVDYQTRLKEPVGTVMTRRFRAIRSGATITEAITVLSELKISELPVIDADDRPIGVIDITDVVGLRVEDSDVPTEAMDMRPSIRLFDSSIDEK
jgi:arabinose-5-phosphate isomerase